jgi:hypothetical protein
MGECSAHLAPGQVAVDRLRHFERRAKSGVSRHAPPLLGRGGLPCSLAATATPWLFPEGFRTATGAVATCFDSAAVVTVLIRLGQVPELRADANERRHRATAGLGP